MYTILILALIIIIIALAVLIIWVLKDDGDFTHWTHYLPMIMKNNSDRANHTYNLP